MFHASSLAETMRADTKIRKRQDFANAISNGIYTPGKINHENKNDNENFKKRNTISKYITSENGHSNRRDKKPSNAFSTLFFYTLVIT